MLFIHGENYDFGRAGCREKGINRIGEGKKVDTRRTGKLLK